MEINLEIHHVGCVVASIEDSLQSYKKTLGFSEVSEVFDISSQKVKVCFVHLGNGTYMEFVEPLDLDSAVGKLLKKRQSYYHIGYKTQNFNETIDELIEKGARIITRFKSEAFDNKECAFLFTQELHMIELIEINK